MASAKGRSIGYDDCLSIARVGRVVSIDTKHFSSLGEQLQAIFNHYASKGSSTDAAPGPRADRRRRGRSDRRRLSGPGRFCRDGLHARPRHGRDPLSA
jgi:hypothetical protein